MTTQLSISQALNSPDAKSKFQELLGTRASQFIASVLSSVNNNALLKKADWTSIYTASITAATLDLPINPNLGFAYLIPYNSKKKIDNNWVDVCEAQFQLGYKGFIQLAQRSGKFKTINVSDVRSDEIVENNRLTGEISFDWLKIDREKAEIVGYVAYFELLNGFSKSMYMSKAELEQHGSTYSKSYNSTKKDYKTQKEEYTGLWRTNFESMAQKTVLKLLLSKYAPLSIQMEVALTSDQAVLTDNGEVYVDNGENVVEVKSEKTPLMAFITEQALSVAVLEKVKDKDMSEEEQTAYIARWNELNKLETENNQ